jgi:hypothetical protein
MQSFPAMNRHSLRKHPSRLPDFAWRRSARKKWAREDVPIAHPAVWKGFINNLTSPGPFTITG